MFKFDGDIDANANADVKCEQSINIEQPNTPVISRNSLRLKPHSRYACAFVSASAFASNCNIASVGCCVKCKEWV